MRPGGGKTKGASFERRICESLSLWLTDGKQKDVFWRSAMSGGRSRVHLNNSGIQMAGAGDIAAVRGIGERLLDKLVIECKRYKNLYLEDLFFGGKRGIVQHWAQVCRDGHDFGRHPMLIARQDHKPALVGVSPEIIEFLHTKMVHVSNLISCNERQLCLAPMDAFFAAFTPKHLDVIVPPQAKKGLQKRPAKTKGERREKSSATLATQGARRIDGGNARPAEKIRKRTSRGR